VTSVIVVALLVGFIDLESSVQALTVKGFGFIVVYWLCLLLMYKGIKPFRDLLAIRLLLKRDMAVKI
jgi:hypothetical protein